MATDCSHVCTCGAAEEQVDAGGEDFVYQVVTLRQSKAVRVEFFRDRGEALEAVGLSEQDAHADS